MPTRMKFLTPEELWPDNPRATIEMFDRYTRYLAQNWSRLPVDLRRIQKSMIDTSRIPGSEPCISLHDAEILQVLTESNKSLVEIKWAIDAEGSRQDISVRYGGVSDVEIGKELAVGDILLYHEIEILADGIFSHRLLFQSDIVTEIEFRMFQLTDQTWVK